MEFVITGSVAYDTSCAFRSFRDHILPSTGQPERQLSGQSMRREAAGVAANVAYTMKLLSGPADPGDGGQ